MSSVAFYTRDLLSKWGFDDGDMFDHDTLIEVVSAYVIPKIEQKVEFYSIGTCHNPIRAKTVDGVVVNDTGDNSSITLTPEVIYVDKSLIDSIGGLDG